jgi:hypothetical protein
LKEKTIKVTIILGEGEFKDGTNTRIIEGLATACDIQKNGLPEKNSAKVKISNLSMDDMEQRTFLAFRPLQSRKNHIMIEAGNKGEELSLCFKGDIQSAFPDFSTAPDVVFNIEAITAGWSVLLNTSPTSVNGEETAEKLIKGFASESGFAFINNGVSDSVRNTTYNGSPPDKARQCASEVNCELIMDDEEWTIQPWDKPRGDAVVLAPDCGLIGYPSFTNEGISCRCFFNPALKLGGQVKIESIVPRASGYWKITRLSHALTAYTQGEWSSSIDAIWLKEEEGREDPKIEGAT